MGFLRRLFGGDGSGEPVEPHERPGDADATGLLVASEATFDAHADRQRVSVWLRLIDASFENEREQQRIFLLEDRIMRRLDETGVGEHDTNALERGYFAIRLIGDDADAIVQAVLPLLEDVPSGGYLAVRRGPAATGEDRIELGARREPGG